MKSGFAATLGASLVVVVACNVAPQQGKAFRPELLSGLSLGMPESQIVALIGTPLRREPIGRGSQARELLTYAVSGALVKGDVSIGSKGYDCLLWLQGGRLDEIFFFNASAQRTCQCRRGNCPSEWASPCQTPVGR